MVLSQKVPLKNIKIEKYWISVVLFVKTPWCTFRDLTVCLFTPWSRRLNVIDKIHKQFKDELLFYTRLSYDLFETHAAGPSPMTHCDRKRHRKIYIRNICFDFGNRATIGIAYASISWDTFWLTFMSSFVSKRF